MGTAGGEWLEPPIRNYVIPELAKGTQPTRLEDDTRLLESGILDSLSPLKFDAVLEGRFSVMVGGEGVFPESFATIGVISNLINSKRARWGKRETLSLAGWGR